MSWSGGIGYRTFEFEAGVGFVEWGTEPLCLKLDLDLWEWGTDPLRLKPELELWNGRQTLCV